MSKCCDEKGRCIRCGARTTYKRFRTLSKSGKPVVHAAIRCTNPKCENY